jgi:plastocyanin
LLRKLLVLALVGAVSAVVATQAFAASSIRVGDNYFVRSSGVPTVTVKKGSTVTWRFAGHNLHTVAVRSGPVKFRSSAKTSGTYKRKMTRAGTYRIYCTIHGAGDQSMRLVVK